MSARIPVYRGDEVVAYAGVDAADYERLASFRWRLGWWGYAERTVNGKSNAMHREVVGLLPGQGKVVHHVNENPLDNRRANLKVCADQHEHGMQPHPKKEARIVETLRALHERAGEKAPA